MTHIRTTQSIDIHSTILACAITRDDSGAIVLADDDAKSTQGFDEDFFDHLLYALMSVDASCACGDITTVPMPHVSPEHKPSRVIAVGIGTDADTNDLREAAGSVARAAQGETEVTLVFPIKDAGDLEAIAEGCLLGSYDFTQYKNKARSPLQTAIIVSREVLESQPIIKHSAILADAVNRVRDLVNTPACALNPEQLAQIALDEARAVGCDVKIWDLEALRADSINGILAVGLGSSSEPRLVRVEWNPVDAQGFTALVGKGITFDSGGYSLKRADSMVEMKTDMGGAATILETIVAVARLGLPTRVVAWLCCAENMVSGTAQRPDDVIRYRNGLNVEVNNTDAEGRLVLADGLLCAVEEHPDAVIDIATLTGAQMVALGDRTTGVMGSPQIRESVVFAADAAGEPAWPMPLPSHLRTTLTSDIADLKNTGSRHGGMLVAGLFLKEFVGDTPWAHIDIAGPSFNREAAYGYMPKGATGVMVRTLVQYFETLISETHEK